MSDSIKYLLEENKAPKFWYNINADLPSPPPPPLHPGTKQPAGPDDFAPLFINFSNWFWNFYFSFCRDFLHN